MTCHQCGKDCIYCSGKAKTKDDVEKLMEDFEDFLNMDDHRAIQGRILKWLGLEE